MKPTPADKNKTLEQSLYEVLEVICDRFKISPFDVLQKPLDEVMEIWVGAVISAQDQNEDAKKQDVQEERERVYSWNATWH